MAQSFVPRYLEIANGVTSVNRLNYLRAFALREQAEHGATYPNPNCPTPKDWREARAWGFGNWRAAYSAGLHQGFNSTNGDKIAVWCSHGEGKNFRHEVRAHAHDDCPHYLSREAHGFYTDMDGRATCYPIIAMLNKGRDEEARYIAGYQWTDNGERVYFDRIFDGRGAAKEACLFAYQRAEAFADIAREDSYQYDQARKLEEKIEESLQRLRECLVMRHRTCMEYVRDEARELLETIRQSRATLKSDYAQYC